MQMTNEEHKTDDNSVPKKALSMAAVATLVFLLLAANCSCGVFAGGGDEGGSSNARPVNARPAIERKM